MKIAAVFFVAGGALGASNLTSTHGTNHTLCEVNNDHRFIIDHQDSLRKTDIIYPSNRTGALAPSGPTAYQGPVVRFPIVEINPHTTTGIVGNVTTYCTAFHLRLDSNFSTTDRILYEQNLTKYPAVEGRISDDTYSMSTNATVLGTMESCAKYLVAEFDLKEWLNKELFSKAQVEARGFTVPNDADNHTDSDIVMYNGAFIECEINNTNWVDINGTAVNVTHERHDFLALFAMPPNFTDVTLVDVADYTFNSTPILVATEAVPGAFDDNTDVGPDLNNTDDNLLHLYTTLTETEATPDGFLEHGETVTLAILMEGVYMYGHLEVLEKLSVEWRTITATNVTTGVNTYTPWKSFDFYFDSTVNNEYPGHHSSELHTQISVPYSYTDTVNQTVEIQMPFQMIEDIEEQRKDGFGNVAVIRMVVSGKYNTTYTDSTGALTPLTGYSEALVARRDESDDAVTDDVVEEDLSMMVSAATKFVVAIAPQGLDSGATRITSGLLSIAMLFGAAAVAMI